MTTAWCPRQPPFVRSINFTYLVYWTGFIFPEFAHLQAATRYNAINIEWVNDGNEQWTLVGLPETRAKSLGFGVDGVQEDPAASRQIVSRVKDRKQNNE